MLSHCSCTDLAPIPTLEATASFTSVLHCTIQSTSPSYQTTGYEPGPAQTVILYIEHLIKHSRIAYSTDPYRTYITEPAYRSELHIQMASTAGNQPYKSTYGNFEKLNKLNYTSWRAKVTGVLRSLRAYKIVTGEEQVPPEGNSAAARAAITDYDARYAQAETTIRLSVNDDIGERLEGVEDPVEMWEILKKEFDSTASEARRTKLAIDFHGLRLESSEKVSAYCARLIRYRKPLHATDEEITDKALLNHIFTTVPASYRTIVHSLKRLPREEITIERALEELTGYEQLVLDDHIGDPNTGSTSGSAMYARGKNGGKKDYNCAHCKMDNHTTEECGRRRAPAPTASTRKHARSNSIMCYQCGEYGHFRSDCEIKKRIDEHRRRHNGNENSRASS